MSRSFSLICFRNASVTTELQDQAKLLIHVSQKNLNSIMPKDLIHHVLIICWTLPPEGNLQLVKGKIERNVWGLLRRVGFRCSCWSPRKFHLEILFHLNSIMCLFMIHLLQGTPVSRKNPEFCVCLWIYLAWLHLQDLNNWTAVSVHTPRGTSAI